MQATGFKIDFNQWHQEVHYGNLEYASLIRPDAELRELLFSIDLPKYIFTNADAKHAEICLEKLGVQDCFQVRSPHH